MSVFAGLTPPYATVVADPPWQIRWSGEQGGRRGNATPMQYSVMADDEIAALPVGDLAALAAHLYLWVTPERNRRGVGIKVAEAWGFAVHNEIVWRKPNFGMGAFPRHGHEILLLARRGGLPYRAARDVHSVQSWANPYDVGKGKRHSSKPPAALDLIESASPGPYVELFARSPRLGWDSWGHGYEQPSSFGGAA